MMGSERIITMTQTGDSGPGEHPVPHVVTTMRLLLARTVSAAGLLRLELHAPGAPHLDSVACDPGAATRELAVWTTPVDATGPLRGTVLVATGPDAGSHRRAAVDQAALLLAGLSDAVRRVAAAEDAARRAEELAAVDALTELGNRRAWRTALEEEARRARRYGMWTTVVIVDLDGLKRINDVAGHSAGDAVLRRGAAALQRACRRVDVACRLGGDEFGVLAPHTGPDGAAKLALRLRESMAAADVAASIGLASTQDGELEAAWRKADLAMYDDKRRRALGSVSPTGESHTRGDERPS